MSVLENALTRSVSAELAAFGEPGVLDPDGDGAPLLARTIIVEREPMEPRELNPMRQGSGSVLVKRARVLVANDATLGHTVMTAGKSRVRFRWHSQDADPTTFQVLKPEVTLEGGFHVMRVEA